MEHEKAPTSIRGVVSKAHSFGGYGGRQGVQRGDSITSTSSAPPHRILSRQGKHFTIFLKCNLFPLNYHIKFNFR